MCKVVSILFLSILITIHSLSQQTSIAGSFLKYVDSSKKNTPARFYILQLESNTPPKIIHRLNLQSLRKITENQYIIAAEKLADSAHEKKFYQYLQAANTYWKLSPALGKLAADTGMHHTVYRFTIAVKSTDAISRIKNNQLPAAGNLHILSVRCTYSDIERTFLNDDTVLFIDILTQKPREELATNGFDLSANKVNQVHNQYPLINGSTQNVSVKEKFYDTTDIDLKNRLQFSPLASKTITNHANLVATIIAGGGNSVYYARGVAWAAGISSSSFEQVLPDDSAYYYQNNITVQNHSYGTGINNSYGLNALAFDKSANENLALLHVFSSGNSGTGTDTGGVYSTTPGYANLTGNFKMAKNVLVVGAVDSFGIAAPFSSKGPAYDGRIKPDLVAFERDGTSESAALVSGTVLLLQQFYKASNNTALPSALAKAILINSADDVNTPGPDYATGFGNLNAIKAMNVIKHNNIFAGRIANDSIQRFAIDVPPNTAQLKVSLVWNDTAAAAFAPRALVNDLDIDVTSPSQNKVWKPWVLNSFPNIDSLTALPQRKRDSLNNVEQVSIDHPQAGIYTINVTGYDIATAGQQYYVAYSIDSLNSFQWYYPAGIDFAEAGREATLRWENTFSGNGSLEYNLPPGNQWQQVPAGINLTKKYYTWAVPDTISPCLLRMKIGNSYFYSDTFLITALLHPAVGFVCGDSILLFWEKLKNIHKYQLYQLGEKYLEPFTKVADTSILLKVSSLSSKYLSVAPLFDNGLTGAKSYTFDYSLQGTGCYIKAFLADQDGGNAILSISLGTTKNVDSIFFEKLSPTGFVPVFNTINIQRDLTFTYQPLINGINIFRAKIILTNGQIIYSGNEPVYYTQSGNYLVFPVPVIRDNNIEVFTPVPGEEILQVLDVSGRIVLQKEIQFPHEYIKTGTLQPGQYFYRILKKGLKISAGKLVVL